MIRWCSYCQRYQGEVEPYEDFSVTHGVCPACLDSGAVLDPDLPDRVEPLKAFLQRVTHAGSDPGAAPALLDEGRSLGVPWVDLLLGLVQPALYQMGERWSGSLASIAEEHRLTAVCASLISLVAEAQAGAARLRQSPAPAALLVNAEDNFHTLGVQVVEVALLAAGVPVFCVYPGLPAREVAALAASLRPRVVGVSVALPEQLGSVRELAALLDRTEGPRPTLVAGGHGVRRLAEARPGAGYSLCRSPAELLRLLK